MKKNIAACLGYILPSWRQFCRTAVRYHASTKRFLQSTVFIATFSPCPTPRHQQLWPVQASVWLSQAILAVICPVAAGAGRGGRHRAGVCPTDEALVDGGFVERDPERMIWTPVAIVGLFLLRGLTSFINDYSTTWLAGHLVMRLREEMFSKLLRLPVSYYDDNASGRVLSRIAYDVNQVTEAGFNIITVTVKDGITILGLLALLFYTDWQLTLICLTMIPVVGISIRYVGRRLRAVAAKPGHHGADDPGAGRIHRLSARGQVYGGAPYELRRFMAAANQLRQNGVKQAATSSSNTGITQLIVSVALAVIIYFASLRASHNQFTAGDFMSFLTAMIMLFAPVKRITSINQSLQKALAAAESVFGFLDEASEHDPGTRELKQPRGKLDFNQVGFYPKAEREALSAIDLHIAPVKPWPWWAVRAAAKPRW